MLTPAITSYVTLGWVIESQAPGMAVLRKPDRWWWLHLLVTIFTCGMWGLAWILFWFVPKRRVVLTVEQGVVVTKYGK